MAVLAPTSSILGLSADVAALGEAVSLAVRIEPQLLRRMRLDLFPTFAACVEADLWFSRVVEMRASSGIVLQPAAAQVLRERLARTPAMLEEAWRVVQRMHCNISPAIFTEERLAYLTLAGKHDELRKVLRSVVATLVSTRGRGLANWAAKAFERLPPEVRILEEAQMLAFGAGLRLGDSGGGEAGLSLARAAEWAAWLAPDDLAMLPFGVALLEDAVEFGPPGRPRSHRIELPRTSPLAVEVEWSDGTRKRTERIPLNSNGVTMVELGPGVTEIDIRSVLGNSWWLTVPAPRNRESLQRKLSRVRLPRVNITYDVEVGGAIQKKELPFVVGVLADLGGSRTEPLPPLRQRKVVDIHLDNFDQVVKAIKPRLDFSVTNLLGGEGNLAVELTFQAMADFEPAAIARQVSPLRELLSERTLLAEVRSLLVSNDKLEGALENVLAEKQQGRFAETASNLSTPSVRAAIEVLEGSANLSSQRAQELAAAFVNLPSPANSRDVEADMTTRIKEIDAALSGLANAILHHPSFQALESAWRGLYYLVAQTESSTMLKIRVWNVAKRELMRDLAEAGEFDQSATFKMIYEDQFGVFGGEPFGLLVGACEFGRSQDDVELLERLSAIAAASHAPCVAAAGPEMFHMKSFGELSVTLDLDKVFDSPEAGQWRTFRQSEDSRYIALTLPRILLRLPYGNNTLPVEEFDFEEDVGASDHSHCLWGSAAFALAARVTNAFAKYQWCAAIRGADGGGLVEGLPVHNFTTEDGDVVTTCPTEIAITDRRASELSWAGFIPLCHAKGTDYAVFFSVSSVQKPRNYASTEAEASARLSVQLPYILAVSRFAHYLKCMMRDKIGSFISRSDTEVFLNRWISDYVEIDDHAPMERKARRPLREARIDIQEAKDRPGVYIAIAYLRPHFQIDELTVSLRVVINLPHSAKG